MPLPFRRERPLHERLAEEGGLVERPAEPLDTRPRWGEVGIHGVHRERRWDAVATAEAPGLHGTRVEFVALPDGTLLVESGVADDAVRPLARALESEVAPPYRAEAVRQDERVWATAARRIEAVELDPDVDGDEFELALADGQRTLLVDGRPAFANLASLERRAAAHHREYVVRGTRLDGPLWEVAITPL